MAAKLVYTFTDSTGTKFNMSYNYADEDVNSSDVKTAGQAIVANGEIFEKVPVALVGAKIIVTTETEFNISNSEQP